MPLFRLSVKDGAPDSLVETSTHGGPIVVEASDETTARVIAKTNFWDIWDPADDYPRLECLWTDRDWVDCEELQSDAAVDHELTRAERALITCPDFDFGNGRFARLVTWPGIPADDEDAQDAAMQAVERHGILADEERTQRTAI